jgi:hypothetical protein
MRRFALPLIALAAALVLLGCYLAFGGASYAPAATPNPCVQRPWPKTSGTAQVAEQVALSAVSGAACQLGVSREELTIALRSRAALQQFGNQHHLQQGKIEDSLKAGLHRAVDDAQNAGAIGGIEALVLNGAIDLLPIDRLLSILQGTSLNWG